MKKYGFTFEKDALKQLKKLDKQVASRIKDWLEKNVRNTSLPRKQGKPLKGNLGNFWSYRIGDYRVIVDIKDEILVVVAVRIAHRKEVY
jgi:mRNA interferase RelE/StbE